MAISMFLMKKLIAFIYSDLQYIYNLPGKFPSLITVWPKLSSRNNWLSKNCKKDKSEYTFCCTVLADQWEASLDQLLHVLQQQWSLEVNEKFIRINKHKSSGLLNITKSKEVHAHKETIWTV